MLLVSLIGVLIVHARAANVVNCPNGLQIFEQGMTTQGKEDVVKAHNYYRDLLAKDSYGKQPKALNMSHVTYDEALGVQAETVSFSCQFEHINVTDSRWSWVGQNIHRDWKSVRTNEPQNWTNAVKSWFDEQKYFSYPLCEDCDKKNIVGHYTQAVWATSTSVGCHYIYFLGLIDNNSPPRYIKLYTCNYGPGGNIDGLPPYRTDDPKYSTFVFNEYDYYDDDVAK